MRHGTAAVDPAAALESAIDDVIAPAAHEIDSRSRFVRGGIEVLGSRGVLGLTLAQESGGGGAGLGTAAQVVRRVARACASTATVLQAHYCAVAALDRRTAPVVQREIAAGEHLVSLALTDSVSDAESARTGACLPRARGGVVRLHGCKVGVPAAGEADSYLWSGVSAEDGSAGLWLVPGNAPGLHVPAGPDPPGLRGAAINSITAAPVRVPADIALRGIGDGRPVIHAVVFPWFVVLGVAVAVGLMEGSVAAAGDTGDAATLARVRAGTDAARGMLARAVANRTRSRPGSGLALLASRAAVAESAIRVTELVALIRPNDETERRCRDARAVAGTQLAPEAVFERIGGAESVLHAVQSGGLATTS